ncbi:MAG: hypothetical protein AAF518_25485 [Spirochaetota bacterium]
MYVYYINVLEKNVELHRYFQDIFLDDATDSFSEKTNSLRWEIFPGLLEEEHHMVSPGLFTEWLDSLKKDIHTKQGKILYEICQSVSENETMWCNVAGYIECEDSFWMVEAVHDEMVVQPIDKEFVEKKINHPHIRAIKATICKEQFSEEVVALENSQISAEQFKRIFQGTRLHLTAEPILKFFQYELEEIEKIIDCSIQSNVALDIFVV